MPPIFIHEKNSNEYIVDGQQRLHTIWRFSENKLQLSDRYSGDIVNERSNKEKNKGQGAYTYNQLHKEWQSRFDSYPIPIIRIDDYDDEEIRELFKRLQHGKPLIPGEILNAYPGSIVLAMRRLAKHNFFKDILPMSPRRYKFNFIVAQMMYLEEAGINDISPSYVYKYFENNRDIRTNAAVCKRINRNLNYLRATFKEKTPEIKKPGWIITLYLLTSYLLTYYSMKSQRDNLKDFFIDFYQKVADSTNNNDKKLMRFNIAASKSTTSQTNIKLRHEIILDRYLNKYRPKRLDENRLFTKEQKLAIFRRDKGRCRECDKKLRYGDKKTHYHHLDRYIEGGKTETDNGMLVCRNCHLNKIH